MTRALIRTAGVATALVLITACASTTGARDGSRDRNVITRAEIDRGQWTDTYDLVEKLRPFWLQTRGQDSFANPGGVQVYVDGTRLGEVGLLRTLPTAGISRLEWVHPTDAAARWGLDHAHGVIAITYGTEPSPTEL